MLAIGVGVMWLYCSGRSDRRVVLGICGNGASDEAARQTDEACVVRRRIDDVKS